MASLSHFYVMLTHNVTAIVFSFDQSSISHLSSKCILPSKIGGLIAIFAIQFSEHFIEWGNSENILPLPPISQFSPLTPSTS
jgi:hypothetical protein